MTSIPDINTLPDEMIMKVVCSLVVEEIKDDKMAKFDLENRALERVRNLTSVCSKWNSVLQDSTKYVVKEILRLLNQVGIRPLFVLRKTVDGLKPIMTTLQDKVYIFFSKRSSTGRKEVQLDVYRLNGYNLEYERSEEFTDLRFAMACTACHDCVCLVGLSHTSAKIPILKITPQNLEASRWLTMPNNTSTPLNILLSTKVCVSGDSNLMLIGLGRLGRVLIHRPATNICKKIPLPIVHPYHVAVKSNGNLVIFTHSNYLTPSDKLTLYEYKDGAENRKKIKKGLDADDVRILWTNMLHDLEPVCTPGFEEIGKMHTKFGVDSDDNIIATDVRGKHLIIFDSLFQCHKFLLKDSGFGGRLSDMHYEEKSNILFLIPMDE